jgi:hypothetical protein
MQRAIVDEKDKALNFAVTTGLAAGAKLRENRFFKITPTGVTIEGEMSVDQWRELMGLWRNIRTSFHVGLADLVSYGRKHFGEDVVQDTMEQLEFDLVDARQAVAISLLPYECRNLWMRTEHFMVIAGADLKPKEAIKWAGAAMDHSLSSTQLKLSILAGKILKGGVLDGESGKNSGMANLPGFRQIFNVWWIRASKANPIEDWTAERQRQVFDELEAPTKLGMKLANALGIRLEEEAPAT